MVKNLLEADVYQVVLLGAEETIMENAYAGILIEELVGGQCRCRAGLTSCGDPPVCVDIRFDEKNCNGCRVECGANEFCDNGVRTFCGPNGVSLSCSRFWRNKTVL